MEFGKGVRVTGVLLQLKDFGAKRKDFQKKVPNICTIKVISAMSDHFADTKRQENSSIPKREHCCRMRIAYEVQHATPRTAQRCLPGVGGGDYLCKIQEEPYPSLTPTLALICVRAIRSP